MFFFLVAFKGLMQKALAQNLSGKPAWYLTGEGVTKWNEGSHGRTTKCKEAGSV